MYFSSFFRFFDLFEKYGGYKTGKLKLKKPKQLQVTVMGICFATYSLRTVRFTFCSSELSCRRCWTLHGSCWQIWDSTTTAR